MVGQRAVALAGERCGRRVDVAPREAVDDSRLAVVGLDDRVELLVERRALPDAVDQVGPIEVAHEHDRIAQAELRHDVVADARGGRGGERVDRDTGERRAQPAQLAVLGPEVVSPVADAVGFVDGDEPDAPAGELLLEPFAVLADETLGRDVEQAEARLAQPVER